MNLLELIHNHSPAFRRQALIPALENAIQSAESEARLLVLCGSLGSGKESTLKSLEKELNQKNEVIAKYFNAETIEADKLASQIRSFWHHTDEERTFLILINNLDDLLRRDDLGQAFFDFERELLTDLVTDGETLIIATSLTELNQWREYEVRTSQVNVQIPPLSHQELDDLVQDTEIGSDHLYQLGLGHPQISQWILRNPEISAREIASRAADYFLESLSLEASRLTLIASQMPLFNAFILGKVSGQAAGEVALLHLMEQINDLMRNGLIFWDEEGSYRFRDSSVRRLIALDLYWQEKDEFKDIHNQATAYFQDEANYPSYLHLHLVSAIYHLARANYERGADIAGQECLRWVEKNVHSWIGADWNLVLQAWKDGAGETAVIEEIIELIGSKHYAQIGDLLIDAQATLEVKR